MTLKNIGLLLLVFVVAYFMIGPVLVLISLAFTLLKIVLVICILGLLALAAFTFFGGGNSSRFRL